MSTYIKLQHESVGTWIIYDELKIGTGSIQDELRFGTGRIIIIFIEKRLQDTIGKIIKYRWLG